MISPLSFARLRQLAPVAAAALALLAADVPAEGQRPTPDAPEQRPMPARPGGGGRMVPGPGQRRDGLPPRDDATPTGTARVRGVVVAAETGTPLRRAIVRLSAAGMRDGRTTMTDAEGRYEVKELPAGRYTVTVSKSGYVNLQYGQRRAFEQGRPLEVADGQTLNGIDFAMPRGGVITGRLVDEFGEPVADAFVTASRHQFFRGRRRLTPAGRPSSTNDLGQFRLYGLSPGEYIVTGNLRSGPMGMMIIDGGSIDDATGYAPTYFPGTSNPGEAQRVRVALGQEATADFALIPARLVRVSGTVLTSSGKPPSGGFVRLVEGGEAAGGMFMTFGGGNRIRGDGSFSLGGVAPGSYTVMISTADFGDADEERESEAARIPITVGNEDLTGLLATTSRGATAIGQIVVEGGQASFTPGNLRIFVTPANPEDDGMMGPGQMRGGRVKEDMTFELRNLFGRSLVTVAGLPGSTWYVKAVTLGGDDITDTGIEARGQQKIDNLQVVLSNQITEVTGTVTDGRSQPVQDYLVVMFADDEARWTHPMNRYISTGRPDQDGKYRIAGLPAGNYHAIAVDSLEATAAMDPEVLVRLREAATDVRLGEGEKKALTLRLQTVP